MTSSSLPPGVSGGVSATDIRCECPNGHSWLTPGWVEMGATFFADEDDGPYCPVCGHAETNADDTVPVDPASIDALYELRDGVYVDRRLLIVAEAEAEMEALLAQADERWEAWVAANPEVDAGRYW